MSIIRKVVAMGAMAAAGAIAANRKNVKKAIRGLISGGKHAVDGVTERLDDLADRAD